MRYVCLRSRDNRIKDMVKHHQRSEIVDETQRLLTETDEYRKGLWTDNIKLPRQK